MTGIVLSHLCTEEATAWAAVVAAKTMPVNVTQQEEWYLATDSQVHVPLHSVATAQHAALEGVDGLAVNRPTRQCCLGTQPLLALTQHMGQQRIGLHGEWNRQ